MKKEYKCPNCDTKREQDFPISDETGDKYCPNCNWSLGENMEYKLKNKMTKYKVFFEQTEHFTVEVEAESKQEADDKANVLFSSGDYDEIGDCSVISTEVKEI